VRELREDVKREIADARAVLRAVMCLPDASLVRSKDSISILTEEQATFKLIEASGFKKNYVLQLALTHAAAAEVLAPGSFNETLSLITIKLEKFSKGNHKFNFEDYSRVNSRLATADDLHRVVHSIDETYLRDVLNTALELAGYGGKISVEKSSSASSSVEVTRGYNFQIAPCWDLTMIATTPKVAIIDGYVEKVSELHHLLEAASASKEPLVIFGRGYHDDVINTLRVNFTRGTLIAVPILVNFDLDGINTLNDIAVVCGSDVVSSNKGDLISSIDYVGLKRVDRVTIRRDVVSIDNASTRREVNIHRSNLLKKRAESPAFDVSKLIDKRIRSLNGRQVIVRLPDDKHYLYRSRKIDVALRTMKIIVDHGIIDGEPALGKVASEHHSDQFVMTLANVGNFI